MSDKAPRTLRESEIPTPRDPRGGNAGPEKKAKTNSNPPRTPRYKEGLVTDALAQTYTQIGVMVAFVDPDIGHVLVERAESMATSWDLLCKNNETVRRRLYKSIERAGWGTVLAAHMPLLLVVGVKAHVVPAPVAVLAGAAAGTPPPTPDRTSHD